MSTKGVVILSHVQEVAYGLKRLMDEIASDVSITYAGGTDDNEVGTSFEKILQAYEENISDDLLVLYDLGSAKMNAEIAQDMTDKTIEILDVAFVEGLYTACALLQAGVDYQEIEKQLEPLKIK